MSVTLKQLRQRKGLTVRAMAELYAEIASVKAMPGNIQQIESSGSIEVETLARYLEALGYTIHMAAHNGTDTIELDVNSLRAHKGAARRD